MSKDFKEGLPQWLSGKESTRQWRRHRFNPWVRKLPWRRKLTHSRILVWKIPCTEQPGVSESDMTEHTHKSWCGKAGTPTRRCWNAPSDTSKTTWQYLCFKRGVGGRGRGRRKRDHDWYWFFLLDRSQKFSQFGGGGVVTKLCPTLASPMDCSPPDSSVHGILQARVLEWVAISFSRGSSRLGIEPRSPASQADSLPIELGGKPFLNLYFTMFHFYNQHEIFCEIKNFSKLTSKLHAQEEPLHIILSHFTGD